MRKLKADTKKENANLAKVLTNKKKLASTILLKQRIIAQAGIKNNRGYVETIEENLTSTTRKQDFEAAFSKGNGNELKKKFKALYSSSALCVNFFAVFKRNVNRLTILGESNFTDGNFEVKLKTGLKGTPPNLDFCLENDNCLIGFESKFLEPLTLKQPKFSSSYSNGFLARIDQALPKIVDHYRRTNAKTNLDTAQLLKHTIGLLNNKGKRTVKLIYVYWEPLNSTEFYEYEQHRKQINDFAGRVKSISGLSFHHFTYLELYDLFNKENFCKAHLNNFKNRYLF